MLLKQPQNSLSQALGTGLPHMIFKAAIKNVLSYVPVSHGAKYLLGREMKGNFLR